MTFPQTRARRPDSVTAVLRLIARPDRVDPAERLDPAEFVRWVRGVPVARRARG